MRLLLRFRMSCHRLPKDEGCWSKHEVPQLETVCRLCDQGSLVISNTYCLSALMRRKFVIRWASLFSGPDNASMW